MWWSTWCHLESFDMNWGDRRDPLRQQSSRVYLDYHSFVSQLRQCRHCSAYYRLLHSLLDIYIHRDLAFTVLIFGCTIEKSFAFHVPRTHVNINNLYQQSKGNESNDSMQNDAIIRHWAILLWITWCLQSIVDYSVY